MSWFSFLVFFLVLILLYTRQLRFVEGVLPDKIGIESYIDKLPNSATKSTLSKLDPFSVAMLRLLTQCTTVLCMFDTSILSLLQRLVQKKVQKKKKSTFAARMG